MNTKPTWAEAPHWANWLAQDYVGAWFWYSHPPVPDEEYRAWAASDPETLVLLHRRPADAVHQEPNDDWANTLEQVPPKTSTRKPKRSYPAATAQRAINQEATC